MALAKLGDIHPPVCVNDYFRTMRTFNFYGLCRIGYGYIDYFPIRIKDLVGFLGTQYGSESNQYIRIQSDIIRKS